MFRIVQGCSLWTDPNHPGCEFPGEGTFCTLRVEGSKAAVEEVMDAVLSMLNRSDHVFVSNDANLIVNAGAGDKLCFTSANLKNCKACFEVYPSRHYFSLQAVVPLLPEPLATRLPEVMHLLRDVHAITEQPGSKVNMQARMGVFLFYRIAESLLSQPFTTESFQDRKKGRDYQTQFSTQLKDEVVQTMKSFLERDGFKFQSVRAEKDISVIHPMVDGGARYKVTTTDSGDMRICQTNGLLPCRDPSHIGKHSRIDVCIVGFESPLCFRIALDSAFTDVPKADAQKVLKHLKDHGDTLDRNELSGYSTDTIREKRDEIWTDGKMEITLRKVKQISLQDRSTYNGEPHTSLSSEVELSIVGMSEAIHEAVSNKTYEKVAGMLRDLVMRTEEFTKNLSAHF